MLLTFVSMMLFFVVFSRDIRTGICNGKLKFRNDD